MTSGLLATRLTWLAVMALAAGCAVTLPQAERALHLETRLDRDPDTVWRALVAAASDLDMRIVATDPDSRLLALRGELKEQRTPWYANVYVRPVGFNGAMLYIIPRVRVARFRTVYGGDDLARELAAGVHRRLEAR